MTAKATEHFVGDGGVEVAVVGEEDAVGVDGADDAVGVAVGFGTVPGEVEDVGLEGLLEDGGDLGGGAVGVLVEDFLGEDDGGGAFDDVAAVEDEGDGVRGDAEGAADGGGVGDVAGSVAEVVGAVGVADEAGGGDLDGHVVAAPVVGGVGEEVVGDAVAVEGGGDGGVLGGVVPGEPGGEVDGVGVAVGEEGEFSG